MSTVPFPGVFRPELVNRSASSVPTLSPGNPAPKNADLTIHRISQTHHGRTLLTLGHAAEYLANSRRYSTQGFDHQANVKAIHILMGLSRDVFEEFAEQRTRNRRFEWVIEQAVRLFE